MSRICAELHCHTLHSDALFTPEELAEAARDNQIDLIALTDHNTLSGYAQMEQTGLPFIHGIEWTTFYGHMLVLGARAFVDWRDAEMDNIDEKIAQVRAQDGLVGIAHPFAPGSPMCTGCYWDFRVRDWSRVNYIEVWNEDFPPLAPHNRRAVALWCSLLDQGYHIAPTYGRDWHRETFSPVPRGCTYLEAEAADEASALSAIAGGRTLLSLGPDVRWSLLGEDGIYAPGDTAKSGAYACRFEIDGERRRSRWGRFGIRAKEAVLLGREGRVLARAAAPSGTMDVRLEDTPFVRLEIRGEACGRESVLALSAPVYVAEKEG